MWYDDSLLVKALKKPRFAAKKLGRTVTHSLQDFRRFYLSSPAANETPINDKEIRIVGLRRTGNHAIINWIRSQEEELGKKVVFLNDVPTHENPYRHQYEYFLDHYPQYPKEIERLRQRTQGQFAPVASLIYSYEDRSLPSIANSIPPARHDAYLGKSGQQLDVIILRDPFNLFASRMKSGYLTVKSSSMTFVDLWLAYAKEFLNETHYLPNSKICISYNRWVDDVNYRKQIAEQLGLTFTDAGFDKVSGRGGGSSFDGKFEGSAQALKLHERWKQYADNPQYRKLIDNPAVREYSERIFGDVLGEMGRTRG